MRIVSEDLHKLFTIRIVAVKEAVHIWTKINFIFTKFW